MTQGRKKPGKVWYKQEYLCEYLEVEDPYERFQSLLLAHPSMSFDEAVMLDRVVGSLEREHRQLLAFVRFRGTKAVFIAKPENAETRSNEPSLLAMTWFDYGLITRLEIARYPNVYSLNFLLSLSRTHVSHNGLAIGDSQLQQYSNLDLLPIHIPLRHSLIRNRPSRVAKMKLMTGIITAIIAFFATTSFAESEGGFMEPCKTVSLKEAFYKPCKECPRRAFYKILAGCTALDGKPYDNELNLNLCLVNDHGKIQWRRRLECTQPPLDSSR
ncbi:hypothetical protein CCUS01_03536 [Colletotrichum cuscutae]|uniref:Uncharacterized protein n=1 Tax=Colletotrichum cuscutae TaxID=1209917 RepID=A0AAI9VIJ4_9PEZI|nr:hypothetical protein CCUS01_03536 [Colletotrichum cuscutae]